MYSIYTTLSFYKVLGKNVSSLWLVQYERTVNQKKKKLCAKKKSNILEAEGDK